MHARYTLYTLIQFTHCVHCVHCTPCVRCILRVTLQCIHGVPCEHCVTIESRSSVPYPDDDIDLPFGLILCFWMHPADIVTEAAGDPFAIRLAFRSLLNALK